MATSAASHTIDKMKVHRCVAMGAPAPAPAKGSQPFPNIQLLILQSADQLRSACRCASIIYRATVPTGTSAGMSTASLHGALGGSHLRQGMQAMGCAPGGSLGYTAAFQRQNWAVNFLCSLSLLLVKCTAHASWSPYQQ